MFLQPDPHSHEVFKMLNDVYGSMAKKVFANGFMAKLVLSGYNPMDVLDYPVCGRCEQLAPWDLPKKYKNGTVVRRCTCMDEKCGHTTLNPVLFRDWIRDEIKKKAPADYVDEMAMASNIVAERLMMQAAATLNSALMVEAPEQCKKMGIEDDGLLPVKEEDEKPDIKVNIGSTAEVDLNKFIQQQEEDLENAE